MDLERIFLEVNGSSIPPGWSVWLDTPPDRGNDNPDYVKLASLESAHLMLWVYSPWEGAPNELARIRVDASLGSDRSIRDTVTCIAFLHLFADFELFYLKQVDQDVLSPLVGCKWDRIQPGAEGLYVFSILNKGTINDTYDIRLNTPPIEAGWNWYFAETGTLEISISLTSPSLASMFGGRTGATFTVAVEAPYNATKDTDMLVYLKGISEELGRSDPRMDELHMIVGERSGLNITVDRPVIESYIGGELIFHVGLTNTGNKDVMMVLLGVEGKTSGLIVMFPEDPIPVYQGQTKWVPVTLNRPHWFRYDSEPGSKWFLNILAVVEGLPSVGNRVTVTFITPAVKGLGAYIQPPSDADLEPGGSLNCSMRISSWSNFNETVTVEPEGAGENLDVEVLDDEGKIVDEVGMEKGELREFIVRVAAREEARVGNYEIIFRLIPEVNEPMLLQLQVNVTQVAGIEAVFRGNATITAGRGLIRERSRYSVLVTNAGNGPDIVSLRLGKHFYLDPMVKVDLDKGWYASFAGIRLIPGDERVSMKVDNLSLLAETEVIEGLYYDLWSPDLSGPCLQDVEFMLGTGNTAEVEIIVWGESEGGYEIVDDMRMELLVGSRGWSERIVLTLYHDLIYPDLAFSDMAYSLYDNDGYIIEEPPLDEEFILVVEAMNIGDGVSENTTIEAVRSGILICRKDIGPLEPGEVRDISIPVRLEGEGAVVILYLDPDNTVHESEDQFVGDDLGNNNRLTIGLKVKDGGAKGDSPLVYVIAGLTGAIAFVAAALILMTRPWRKVRGPVH